MTPDEVMRMSDNEALIFTSGQPAIRAAKLRYFKESLFIERAKIPPPQQSDRIIQRLITETAVEAPGGQPPEANAAPSIAASPVPPPSQNGKPASRPSTRTEKEPEQRVLFLRTKAAAANGKVNERSATAAPETEELPVHKKPKKYDEYATPHSMLYDCR
jgi:type IV secretory pathway TraG/TraD family ATPase VirD4